MAESHEDHDQMKTAQDAEATTTEVKAFENVDAAVKTQINGFLMELATLSEAVFALAKAYRPNESELYYQFCPMAKNGEGAN